MGFNIGDMFGFNSGDPYKKGMEQLQHYYNEAKKTQQPYYDAGTNSIPQYQNWLNTMQDPSGFINNMMAGYSESPWARYQQDQSMRAATNMASANGLAGSTPMQLQAQQNAANISSQDMNSWLSNVLGINTQYGAGEGNLVNMGQNNANSLMNLMSSMGGGMAKGAFGKKAANQQDMINMLSMIAMMFGG
jgi:hypothetical protein